MILAFLGGALVAGGIVLVQRFSQTIPSFCRPQNGARLGANGYRYRGVCPAHLEGPVRDAHTETFGLYERQALTIDLKQLVEEKASLETSVPRLEDDLARAKREVETYPIATRSPVATPRDGI